MNSFRPLQALTLVVMALLIAPRLVPGLRPYDRTVRLAAFVIYLAGALVILAIWLLTRP
jgi:hypothetical protein